MPSTSYSWRRLFLFLHRWLGIASALIVAILCLSGTILAVQEPVESWVNRDVLTVQPQGDPLPLEMLVPQVAAETGKTFTAIVVKPDPSDAVQFLEGRQATYVNPYTGEVLGGVNPTVREGFMWFFRLHRWLLLETPIGRPITGAATLIFLFILLSGLILWWPKRLSGLKRVLTMRSKVNWMGRNYDLHVVLGFYTLIPLGIMAASGLFWSYNPQFQQVVYTVLDGKPAPESALQARRRGAAPGPGQPMPRLDLPYTALIAETHAAYPYRGPVRVTLPTRPDQPVEMAKTHAATAISLPYVDRLHLDAESATIVKRESFAEKTRAEKLLSLIKAIHIGTVYGGLSLTVYFLASLIGASLPITGFVWWWGKRKARRPRQTAKMPVNAATTLPADGIT